MKKIKILISLFVLTFLIGCSKTNEDINLDAIAAPTNISAKISIAPDNTGTVTIIPIGEGISQFEVYYGDSTVQPALLGAGVPTVHRYNEGNYTLKIVGITLNGKRTERTFPIAISFFPPTNLAVNLTISSLNTMEINVTATADFQTNFKIYYGENPNEVPETFLEGETKTHVYTNPGTYQVRVFAVSGSAQSAPFTRMVTVTRSVLLLLPVDFESSSINYSFLNFDGGNSTRVANPFPSGINTSPFVAKMIKGPGQVWGGSLLSLSSPMDFSVNKKFKVKVYSPRAGAKLLLKVENLTNSGINFEREVTITTANAWQQLTFDYTPISTTNLYQKLVFIFDLGTQGDASANYTFYFDDVILTN
ncbi:MAG: fibronectin type III domain-containing protein [Flavobacteriaceae bacterium]|nr:fibronectin type III domain-containing protein [Flavobacteriaceae bacterium]